MSLNLSKAKGFVVKVVLTKQCQYDITMYNNDNNDNDNINKYYNYNNYYKLPLLTDDFFPKIKLPPSRPNRNSTNRRLRGNLLGKISSVFVEVEGPEWLKLEAEEE